MPAPAYHATPTDALLTAIKARQIRYADLAVFLVISRYADVPIVKGYRQHSYPSIATIAAWTGRRTADIPAALRRLEAAGLIETDGRRPGRVTIWRIPVTGTPPSETVPSTETVPPSETATPPPTETEGTPPSETATRPITPYRNPLTETGAQAPDDGEPRASAETWAAVREQVKQVLGGGNQSAASEPTALSALLAPLPANPEADAQLAKLRAQREEEA